MNTRVKQIRNLVEATEQEYEKEKLNERIARLSGGVAIIQVGPMAHVSGLSVSESLAYRLFGGYAGDVQGAEKREDQQHASWAADCTALCQQHIRCGKYM